MDSQEAHKLEPKQLLRIGVVEQRVAFGRAHLYALISRGHFPRPVKFGKSNLWVASEVDAWITRRIEERDTAAS